MESARAVSNSDSRWVRDSAASTSAQTTRSALGSATSSAKRRSASARGTPLQILSASDADLRSQRGWRHASRRDDSLRQARRCDQGVAQKLSPRSDGLDPSGGLACAPAPRRQFDAMITTPEATGTTIGQPVTRPATRPTATATPPSAGFHLRPRHAGCESRRAPTPTDQKMPAAPRPATTAVAATKVWVTTGELR